MALGMKNVQNAHLKNENVDGNLLNSCGFIHAFKNFATIFCEDGTNDQYSCHTEFKLYSPAESYVKFIIPK